jgi:hypothetical protein
MAQRTIHYLFGEVISNHLELTDKKRFLLGSIMPDAVEVSNKDRSHFKVRTDRSIYLDFEAFRNQYGDLMRQDDLYLGYYMHLVEDAFYREFIYQDRFAMPRTWEEVKLLHNDYHILNSYIVEKYDLHNILEKDMVPAHEPIGGIEVFLLRESLSKLADEFAEQTQGDTVFLTEAMLDEFVEIYLPLVTEEAGNVKNGTSTLKSREYAWYRSRGI